MVALQKNDSIFGDVMIEAGCLDHPGVTMKGVRISEGPLYNIWERAVQVCTSRLNSAWLMMTCFVQRSLRAGSRGKLNRLTLCP